MDIAFHICAWNKLPIPESYKDVFPILAKNSLLEKEIADKMEKWMGLRNIIAHIYEKVDDALLFNIIKKDLGDLGMFLKALENMPEV